MRLFYILFKYAIQAVSLYKIKPESEKEKAQSHPKEFFNSNLTGQCVHESQLIMCNENVYAHVRRRSVCRIFEIFIKDHEDERS